MTQTKKEDKGSESRPITSAEVLDFLKIQMETLRASVPGYIAINIESRSLNPGEAMPLEFKAYAEHVGHSPPFKTAESAVAWVVAKIDGRTESEVIRAKAAEMIMEAQKLEEVGK